MLGGILPFFRGGFKADKRPSLSDEEGVLSQQSGGQRWHQSKQRKLYTSGMAAAGAVVPIFSNGTQQFGLFNPAGSGVVADIVEIAMTYVSTTGAAGGYVLALVKDAGADKATGGNLTAYTALSVWEGISDGNAAQGNKCKGLTAFGVTAPVIWRHIGQNQLVTTAADATTVPWTTRHRYEGDCGIRPGTVLCVAGNIATLSIFAFSITWAEEKDA
jgi:hypothetical protein